MRAVLGAIVLGTSLSIGVLGAAASAAPLSGTGGDAAAALARLIPVQLPAQLADSGTCAWNCQSRYSSCQSRCRTYSCKSSCQSRYSACLTRCTTRN